MKVNLNNKKNWGQRRGQSLMELLIGMAVGGLLIVGSAAIIASSLQSNGRVAAVQAQAQLGSELLNNLRSFASGNWNGVLALATGTANEYYLNTATSPFTAVNASSSGASSTYLYSRSITVSASQVSSTQTNFPMLISGTYSYLAASSSGGYAQNANGYDVIFTSDASGTTPLNWEVESYTSSTGNIVAWVNIPSLTSSTVIYMFYDNPAITTFQGNAAGTWNSNYVGVWHLPNGSSLSANDSTANGNNGTLTNSPTATTGEIGGGANFVSSSSQYVTMGNPGVLNFSGNFTISEWIKPGASVNVLSLNKRINSSAAGYEFLNGPGGVAGQMIARIGNTSGTYLSSAIISGLNDGSWHYVVATFNTASSNLTIYKDGINGGTASLTSSTYNWSNTTAFELGARAGASFFNGGVDEARVSTVANSDSWILTEYNNQNSPSTFYTLGSQTAGGGASGTSYESITNNGVIYQRYFYASDIYRDVSGNVTSTASGNFYDPSTKQFTVVVTTASSTVPPMNYVEYVTRNIGTSVLNQSNWGGGKKTGTATFVSSTYSNATNTIINALGSLQLSTSTGGSYSNGYAYSRPITVSSSKVSSTQSNFPMLISGTYTYLKASSSGGYAQNANGYDIMFTADASGTIPLNWEVESYTRTTGNIIAWVNIPTLTSSTVIYMFYDNPSVTNFRGNPPAMWNSNYMAVWHFPSTTTSSLQESTINGINGTNVSTTATTGEIGGGITGNGSSEYIALSNNTGGPLDLNRNFTISAWIKRSTACATCAIISHGNGGWYLRTENNKLSFLESNTAALGTSASTFSSGTWQYVVFTLGSGSTATGTFYINGASAGTLSTSADVSDKYGYNPSIGSDNPGGSEFFQGSMDEIRVSNVALSASWIKTEYNNQSSPSTFYTVGSQSTNGAGGGGPTLVQKVIVNNLGYNYGQTVPLPTSTKAGDLIVVSYINDTRGDTNPDGAASDPANGTYLSAASSSDFDNRNFSAIDYMPNAAVATSVTISVADNYAGWGAVIYEFSGIQTGNPLDQATSTPGVTYNYVSNWSVPLTAAATGDLLIGVGEMPDPAVLNTSTFNIDWYPSGPAGWGPIFASAISGAVGIYPFYGTSGDYGRITLSVASFFSGTATPPSGNGTLDSQPFDTGSSLGTQLNSFVWQGSEPVGTAVDFQFATSNASSGPWSYIGPDGTSNTYFSGNPGTPITLFSTTNGYAPFSGSRYFSYRTFLYTSSTAITPTVNGVSVNWSP